MRIIPFILMLLVWRLNYAQTPVSKYSEEVESNIKKFENGLYSRIKIVGDTGWALLDRMAHYKINGLSIAVVHNYKVEWAKGYGWADIAEKRPVTSETYFQIGSISKSFNSTAILKLVQEGKLDLNTDVNDYLTSWKFPYDTISHGKKITLAQLLSHSAGLSGGGSDYSKTDVLPTIYQVLDGTPPATSPPVRSIFEPGIKHSYSNGGVTISMLVLSEITKKVYQEYLTEVVLKRLGMKHTFYDEPAPAGVAKQLATGYDQAGNEIEGKYRLLTQQAGGSVWSTPSDLCKFVIEMQESYKGRSNKILSRQTTRLFMTPQIAVSPNGDSAGLGVFLDRVNSIKYFKHSGSRNGFTSMYYGSVDGGDGFVVFLNSTNNSPILQEIFSSIATTYKWKGFENPVIRKVIPIADSIMNKYIGVYKIDKDFAAIVKRDDQYKYYSNGKFVAMYFTTEKDFFNLEFLADKQFYFDNAGRTIGFSRIVGKDILSNAIKVSNFDSISSFHANLNDVAWAMLENKDFENSIRLYDRALALYPSEAYLYINAAHAYLFSGQYGKALELYKQFLNDKFVTDYSKPVMIKEDFLFFKSKGFSPSPMDKVLNDLGITP